MTLYAHTDMMQLIATLQQEVRELRAQAQASRQTDSNVTMNSTTKTCQVINHRMSCFTLAALRIDHVTNAFFCAVRNNNIVIWYYITSVDEQSALSSYLNEKLNHLIYSYGMLWHQLSLVMY